ncbi:MAG: hypothetical protein EOM67_15530 [Spirochaetia bacterium]|uniref:Uncharacterized protein n=1 Tax=Sulfurospirillum diekertiae TaxID=1854492 RepID=A0A1Y0HJ84_9BACT|nr:hypothetical protein [Sulfurospirillum diekertiae]ARU48167.1 hypothetical protein Sdiek1_1001 [Sulfurospirillum diekertiae]ASC93010.1 hypothetical protein Sdiek2_0989 [Sulfurospirillum diekertiae]NCB03542.1 hypothetical protein [Spirochaetia bacterium]
MFEILPCLPMVISIMVAFTLYLFLLNPINRRYEAALNHLLAKEIARKLYQEMHPGFSYTTYHEDDDKRKAILNSAVEEFRKLMTKDV